MIKKSYVFYVSVILFSLVILDFASAAVSIEKQAVADTVITELDEPAIFEFHIKNTGSTDNFEIYSLADVDITPVGTFRIKSEETKKIVVKIYPSDKVKQKLDQYTFFYKLRGQNSGTQENRLTIKIYPLKDALEVSIENVNPDSLSTTARVKNKLNFDFKKINAVFTSALFSHKEVFSLGPEKEREFEIAIDKNKTNSLIAGSYSFNTNVNVDIASTNLKGQLEFTEKSLVSTTKKSSGLIIYTKTIEKTNDGNIPAIARTSVKKDAISRLFTSFDPEPGNVDRIGFVVVYNWQKEVLPGESLKVRVRTNWIFPLILIALVVIVVLLVSFYLKSNLIVKKKVKFVETKAGVLALKVILFVSAKKFVEKISLIDKVPALMKIYERYGEKPDRVDDKNNRVEWNIENLDNGETRVFSYVVYSKIGIVGRLELPPATAVYEKNNKICESKSNKAFFIAEPRKIEEE